MALDRLVNGDGASVTDAHTDGLAALAKVFRNPALLKDLGQGNLHGPTGHHQRQSFRRRIQDETAPVAHAHGRDGLRSDGHRKDVGNGTGLG